MNFIAVSFAILSLFILIGFGFLLRKKGILDGTRIHWISHILVNIALPALTISSMQMPSTEQTIGIVDHMLVVAFAYYILAFLLSILICHFLPSTKTEKGVIQFMLVFPNVGFMGIPVAEAVLGHGALFYVILFNLPFNFLVFSMGVWLLAHGRPGRFDPRLLITPGLVASILGLALFWFGLDIPSPADTILEYVGATTTPLAMIVVGAMLATLPVRKLAGDWRVFAVSLLRLIVLPVLAFIILAPIISDRLLLGVAVLLIAMPVAANSVLLSEEYEVDATLASQGVFLSTVLSLITLPLIAFLFI
jgi:hypothetical protein